VTFQIVWQYTPIEAGLPFPVDANRSTAPSSARPAPAQRQHAYYRRLGGRLIEVTSGHEIVWETSALTGQDDEHQHDLPRYRVPYEWVPAGRNAAGAAIERIDVTRFRVPGASFARAGW